MLFVRGDGVILVCSLLRSLVYTAVFNLTLGVSPCSNVIMVTKMRRLRAVYQVNVFMPHTPGTYNIVQSLPSPIYCSQCAQSHFSLSSCCSLPAAH